MVMLKPGKLKVVVFSFVAFAATALLWTVGGMLRAEPETRTPAVTHGARPAHVAQHAEAATALRALQYTQTMQHNELMGKQRQLMEEMHGAMQRHEQLERDAAQRMGQVEATERQLEQLLASLEAESAVVISQANVTALDKAAQAASDPSNGSSPPRAAAVARLGARMRAMLQHVARAARTPRVIPAEPAAGGKDAVLRGSKAVLGMTDERMQKDLGAEWPCSWKILISMLTAIVAKFESKGMRYFLTGGTAVAAFRHNDRFIWWESDIDVGLFAEDENWAEELVTEIAKENPKLYSVRKFPRNKDGSVSGFLRLYSAPEGKMHKIHVDVLPYRYNPKRKGYLPSPTNGYIQHKPVRKEAFEWPVRCGFMGLHTYCPADITIYMDDRYGFREAKRRKGHKPWTPTALERRVFCNNEPDPLIPAQWD